MSIVGGIPQQLNVSPPISLDVANYDISPDSNLIAFVANLLTQSKRELFSVSISGGTPTRLNQDLLTDQRVDTSLKFTVDSSKVIYRANTSLKGGNELFATPASGDGPVSRLHLDSDELLQTFATVSIFNFLVAPDGENIIFYARNTINNVQLFHTTSNARYATKLREEKFTSNVKFNVTIDGAHIVAMEPDLSTGKLFIAPIDGSDQFTTINTPKVDGVAGGVNGFWLSPDGNHVAYRLNFPLDKLEFSATYVYTIDSNESAGPIPGGFIAFTPDSSSILHTSNTTSGLFRDINNYSISSNTSTKISSANTELLRSNSGINSIVYLAEDSSRIAYQSPKADTGRSQLVSISPTGGEELVIRESAFIGQVVDFQPQFSGNSDYLIYKYNGSFKTDLFSVKLQDKMLKTTIIPGLYCLLLENCIIDP